MGLTPHGSQRNTHNTKLWCLEALPNFRDASDGGGSLYVLLRPTRISVTESRDAVGIYFGFHPGHMKCAFVNVFTLTRRRREFAISGDIHNQVTREHSPTATGMSLSVPCCVAWSLTFHPDHMQRPRAARLYAHNPRAEEHDHRNGDI